MSANKIKVTEAIVVEGKYDKIKLSSLLDALIISINGFGIYKDKEKLSLIRTLAEKRGLIIITDSDHAGFQIRNFLKNAVRTGNIKHVYIPDVFGKEKRKDKPSAENKLGVEGMSVKALAEAFARAGINFSDKTESQENFETNETKFSKAQVREILFDAGLIGGADSVGKRGAFQKKLGLPENLSSGALTEVLAECFNYQQYKEFLS